MTHYEETMSMVEDFKKAKFSEEQTKVILRAVESAQKDGLENLATKDDIHSLELKISDVKSELKEDIHKLDLKVSEIRNEFTKLDGSFNTLKWMLGFIGTVSVTGLGILITLLFSH